MRKVFTLMWSMLIVSLAQGQDFLNTIENLQFSKSGQSWFRFNPDAAINSSTILQKLKSDVLNPELNDFRQISAEVANPEHLRYQQFYQDIPVLGSEIIIHQKDEVIYSINGQIAASLDLSVVAGLDPDHVLNLAKADLPSEQYAWESDHHHLPEVKLCIMDKAHPEHSGEYVLAYRVDVYSHQPLAKKRYYMDANSGEIILSHNMLMTCFGGGGTAETLYHGTRMFETHIDSSMHELNDLTRGNGIETISATGKKYFDEDNNWEAGSFTQKVGALDVHYGAQATYDFYKNYFNRDGVDGKNTKLLNKIIDTTQYVNAFWDGAGTNFGIGDGVNTNPLTSLDVVAHEITHGVTQFTCGLEYLYESGALNEGFSDIFGKAIEFEYDSIQFDWLIGSKFFNKADTAFRSMQDPLRFGNPKNYKGSRWVANSGDNGGVHSNSGVVNHWFYLLSEGGSGFTEKNIPYDVKKIGIRKATALVYEAMSNYLISTSKYYDMRQATLEITAKEFGNCSDEYKNIVEAWVAVGIGARNADMDIMLVNEKTPQISCREGLFPVEVRLLNLSCENIIPAGTDLVMTISVPQKNQIREFLTLTEDLLPGKSINYAFQNLARIDRNNILIHVECLYTLDGDTVNNRLPLLISKNNNYEHDFRVSSANVTGSACEGGIYMAQIISSYRGCHPVPAGTDLKVRLLYDNTLTEKTVTTTTTIYPNANYRTPRFEVDRDFSGYKRILAQLDYVQDTILNNNSALFDAVYIDNSSIGYLEEFTSNRFDSSLLGLRLDSFQISEINSSLTGSDAIVISGGKVVDDGNRFLPIINNNISNFYSSNPKFTSSLYLCVNTLNLGKAFVAFDYIQKISNPIYDSLFSNPGFAATTRLIFRNENGATIGDPVYIQNAGKTAELRYFEQEIPLTGGPVRIEIQNIILEGSLDSLNRIDLTKDYILFDNLKIIREVVAVNDQTNSKSFSINPNPFKDFIDISTTETGESTYELRNLHGAILLNGKFNTESTRISTNQITTGTYYLKLTDSKGKQEIFKLLHF